jgi:hypothetical protein
MIGIKGRGGFRRAPGARRRLWGRAVATIASTFAAAALAAGLTACGLTRAVWHRHKIGVAMADERPRDSATFRRHDSIPVLHLRGTPREIGAQHGRALRRALRELDAYLRAIVPRAQMEAFFAQAQARSRSLPPEYREELAAMAEAANVPYDELLAINVIPRLQCSALAVWGDATRDGATIMGRNADYFGLGLADRGGVVAVYHPAEGEAVAAVTFLGMIGAFTGINEHGVAFGNMLVFNAADPGPDPAGLPVQLAMRMAAHRAESAGEFARYLLDRRHAIPMNVIAADSSDALVLELGHNGSSILRGDRGFVAVSNHFRTPALCRHLPACERLAGLEAFAEEHRGRFDVPLMEQALFGARIPDLNLQAAVFEPARMRMHVSLNRVPASAGPYVAFDLRELFATSPIPNN